MGTTPLGGDVLDQDDELQSWLGVSLGVPGFGSRFEDIHSDIWHAIDFPPHFTAQTWEFLKHQMGPAQNYEVPKLVEHMLYSKAS